MTRLRVEQVLKDKESREPNSITSTSLTHRALSDVSCLAQFISLERLDLASNNLTSVQGLGSCVNLKWLSLLQNKLQSLKGIEPLVNLTVLNAGKNKLKSMDEVASLVSLRALILNDNEIGSICRLDQLKELNTLILSRNPIREIGESLAKVKSITKLSLSSCQLHAIGLSLKSCIELKELRLTHNEIKTVPAELAYNKKLQNLDLGNNVIMKWSDIKVLNALVYLKNLNIRGNPIAEHVENEKLVKKVLNLLPNLHILNARPVGKGTTNGNNGGVDGPTLIPDSQLEVHKEDGKDLFREKKSSNLGMEKDTIEKTRKAEFPAHQKDDPMVEAKIKRKKSQDGQHTTNDPLMGNGMKHQKKKMNEQVSEKEVPVKDGSTIAEKKLKSEKPRKVQGDLDVIDDPEASFADLFSTRDAAEHPRYDAEKRTVEKSAEVTLGGLVNISSTKKKSKSRGVDPATELPPAVEIGLGGPSAWDD